MSRKLTPNSIARFMISTDSSSPVLFPKLKQPRHSLLTFTPVRPRLRYSMACSLRTVKRRGPMVAGTAECRLALFFYLHAYSVERVILVT